MGCPPPRRPVMSASADQPSTANSRSYPAHCPERLSGLWNKRPRNPNLGSRNSRRVHPPPIQPVEQGGELRPGQAHDPVADRRPFERAAFQPLPDQHQPRPVIDEQLHAIAALRAEHEDRAAERILLQDRLHRPRQTIGAAAEINRARGNQHPRPRRQALRDNRRLLRRAPAPPTRRSRQNLNPPETVPINWQITWQTSLPASTARDRIIPPPSAPARREQRFAYGLSQNFSAPDL